MYCHLFYGSQCIYIYMYIYNVVLATGFYAAQARLRKIWRRNTFQITAKPTTWQMTVLPSTECRRDTASLTRWTPVAATSLQQLANHCVLSPTPQSCVFHWDVAFPSHSCPGIHFCTNTAKRHQTLITLLQLLLVAYHMQHQSFGNCLEDEREDYQS